MRIRFTTAARLAETSMNLTWKENIAFVFLAGIVTPLVIVGTIIGVGVMAIAEIGMVWAVVSATWNAVMMYADILTYPGVTTLCIGAAWLFAKTRQAKPRKFFDWLAQGMFWYFTTIASLLALAGFSWLVKTYDWPLAILAVLTALAAIKAIELTARK